MIRTAFFPDSYLEVNGVAHTSRHLAEYAKRQGHPFLCVHAGQESATETVQSWRRIQLKRSPVSFGLDRDLIFDILYLRHLDRIEKECRQFAPEVVHITGPNDNGMLGALIAHRLRIPLVVSWHTNLHEYSGRRTASLLRSLPAAWVKKLAHQAELHTLNACLRYYQLGRVLLAPNAELCALLERRCKRPCFLMSRGVDTSLFSPGHRKREDDTVNIGYVGRLTAEKNVRLLAEIEKALLEQGLTGFKFTVIGQGSEGEWLRQNMKHVELPGVLRGEALSRAYANMDIFVFPSPTDTFGNVVLEAQSAGVPAVVSDSGGPKFIVHDNATGFVARTREDFVKAVARLITDPQARRQMGDAARSYALAHSWDSVFEKVYNGYQFALGRKRVAKSGAVVRTVS
ncbi:MAG TPA: glycosyltransferase [Candidatus Angelobacter sp.]|nr:glycosyltransferase [Candidatus Angelobacter sp.]